MLQLVALIRDMTMVITDVPLFVYGTRPDLMDSEGPETTINFA